MSFKNWITNMSGFEMFFLILGITVPIIFMIAIFFSFRGNSPSIPAARIFIKRESWPGELYKSQIESWQQTNTRYGNDFFFDIYFYLDNTLLSAKALIAPGQMHLLRKGLPIVVKKGAKNRIAVMQIGA